MLVISIQSQVVHGHVGNSAAVYPMQAEGVTVAAVPTALLSNHPHYPTMRGTVLDAGLVADLLRGVEERGLIERAAVLLTGYLGSPDIAEHVARFAAAARKRNPNLIYLCDPVVGDDDLGVFVADGLTDIFRNRLVPLASIITPNQFELELLAGTNARDEAGLLAASAVVAAGNSAAVIATGCTLANTPDGEVETILCTGGMATRIATPRLPIRPCGTGDLLSGLVAAHVAKGADVGTALRRAVEGTYRVLERTQQAGADEMCLFPVTAKAAPQRS
ncbi:pyridoxal kinase [Agrobacterium tumefaciens]|uniref:pyridoxal kinase n=1 Tax=Agrobacterium tumefaciens complex TaxID=1183400 RepID=UPI001571E688|nr:pyridoxal kinase [Agrobacterium fabrum]NSZ09685.1 pyridoxal kinase [Agrobacterium tumefaciens]